MTNSIILTDGRMFRGEVISETEDLVKLEWLDRSIHSVITIPKGLIRSRFIIDGDESLLLRS